MTKNNLDSKSGLYVVIQVGSHALMLFLITMGGGDLPKPLLQNLGNMVSYAKNVAKTLILLVGFFVNRSLYNRPLNSTTNF